MWTVFAVETTTGRQIGTLPALIQSWSRELNGQDALSIMINPGGITAANRDQIMPLLEPNRMSLILDWDGIAILWCVIQTVSWANNQLTVAASDYKTTVFSKRKLHTWATPYATETITYSNMSLGSIAIQYGKVGTDPSKAGSSLPIVWPTIETDTDPTHTRTVFGYELKTVNDGWSELTGVQNGPDIDLQPQWVDSSRQYAQLVFRVGTDEQPMLFGPNPVAFDWAAPESQVQDLSVVIDGSLMATTEWALGNGTDVSTLMSRQQSTALTNAGYPLLEGENDYTSTTLQSTLDASAAGDLATFSTPTVQWGLKVNAQKTPTFGSYSVGDLCTVRVKNHPVISDNLNGYAMRMIGFSGDGTPTVTVDVQEQG